NRKFSVGRQQSPRQIIEVLGVRRRNLLRSVNLSAGSPRSKWSIPTPPIQRTLRPSRRLTLTNPRLAQRRWHQRLPKSAKRVVQRVPLDVSRRHGLALQHGKIRIGRINPAALTNSLKRRVLCPNFAKVKPRPRELLRVLPSPRQSLRSAGLLRRVAEPSQCFAKRLHCDSLSTQQIVLSQYLHQPRVHNHTCTVGFIASATSKHFTKSLPSRSHLVLLWTPTTQRGRRARKRLPTPAARHSCAHRRPGSSRRSDVSCHAEAVAQSRLTKGI